jgi:hypothetical protein
MLKLPQRDNMKFKELREANLSKAQINKVHDKADDLPKSDFIKRYGKEGDAVRFATATNIVKKQLGIESLDKEDEKSVGRVIKQLKKAVKAHQGQVDTLAKDIKDEVELDEVHFSNRGEPPAPKGMHKLRSGRDVPSSPKVDKIHKKVAAMTDRNDHFGATIQLAKECGDKDLVQIYKSLELMHRKYGVVGNKSIELRQIFSPVLNNQLDRKFGKYANILRDAL